MGRLSLGTPMSQMSHKGSEQQLLTIIVFWTVMTLMLSGENLKTLAASIQA